MSRSSRAASAARVIGTLAASAVLAVGAAHTALACSIGDFTAAAVCDAHGKGVVRVTDKDASGTPATVSLFLQLNQPINNLRLVDTKKIEHPTARGVTVDLTPLDWYAGETFQVHIKAGDQVDDDIEPLVVVQDESCATGTPSPSASAAPSGRPSPSSTPSSTSSASVPSSSPSTSTLPGASATAVQGGSGSAPSPAGGGTALAETGANGSAPMVAGVAAALVLVGGGTVLALRRRRAPHSH
ncbi:LAETG motif-containing sortase-dependent surface protein [Streptomyces sp. IBSBF 2806]|uniref:LAETG motif-containing sortase-dependent surface protein n=1 Tax=Streptomyces sp. IBSBF 2806 TaxID=2903529 RepID=UPI002FDC506F